MDDSKNILNPYVKRFEGDEVQVEMVLFNEKNKDHVHDALIKFTGTAAHQAGIDGMVFRYYAETTSQDLRKSGINFMKEGGEFRIMSLPSPTEWQTKVFLNQKTYVVQAKGPDVKDERAAQYMLEDWNSQHRAKAN